MQTDNEMRTCDSCGMDLSPEEFSMSDHLPWGLEGWCNTCFKAKRARAWAAYRKALKESELVRPETCDRCGTSGKIIGHHVDYFKPLAVKWVCQACHRREHKEGEMRRGTVVYIPQDDEA